MFERLPSEGTPGTRDRLIGAMLQALSTRGLHGVGINELLVAARAPKGVLYHHFPGGKTELAVATIEQLVAAGEGGGARQEANRWGAGGGAVGADGVMRDGVMRDGVMSDGVMSDGVMSDGVMGYGRSANGGHCGTPRGGRAVPLLAGMHGDDFAGVGAAVGIEDTAHAAHAVK